MYLLSLREEQWLILRHLLRQMLRAPKLVHVGCVLLQLILSFGCVWYVSDSCIHVSGMICDDLLTPVHSRINSRFLASSGRTREAKKWAAGGLGEASA